jgi:hypothetical protein
METGAGVRRFQTHYQRGPGTDKGKPHCHSLLYSSVVGHAGFFAAGKQLDQSVVGVCPLVDLSHLQRCTDV